MLQIIYTTCELIATYTNQLGVCTNTAQKFEVEGKIKSLVKDKKIQVQEYHRLFRGLSETQKENFKSFYLEKELGDVKLANWASVYGWFGEEKARQRIEKIIQELRTCKISEVEKLVKKREKAIGKYN